MAGRHQPVEGADSARALVESMFMENVVEARENGFALVCATCGCGIADDSDMHQTGCKADPDPGRLARELAAASRRNT